MSDQIDGLTQMRARLDDVASRRDWPALLAEARAAAAAYPSAWEPAHHEGRALLETGAYDAADVHLQRCMARFPDMPQFAVLYGYVGGRSLSKQAAVDRWSALQSKMPEAPGLRVGLAHGLKSIGQFGRAEEIITEGLRRAPNLVPLLVQHADLAAQRGAWDTAAERWEAVLARAPQRTDAMAARIGALRQAGRLDEAEQVAQASLAAHPDDEDLNTSTAAVAAARQNWAVAAACLERVLAVSPGNLPASIGLVGARLQLGKPDLAEAAARAGLVYNPDNEILLTEYAAIAVKAERWPDAVARWGQVYERCPPRVQTYLAYIEALEKEEDFVLAEEIATEAVAFAPDDRALLLKHVSFADRRADATESQKRWQNIRRRFQGDPEITEAALSARKMQNAETAQRMKDEAAMRSAPIRGSLSAAPKTAGPTSSGMPQLGPTALDLLMTGKVQPPPPPPKPSFGARLRRFFGGT